MNRTLPLILAVALAAGGAGFFLAQTFAPEHPRAAPAAQAPPRAEDLVGSERPDFSHRDLAGNTVSADDFDGRILLVNFWASWCAPCVEEMPMLSQLQQALGPAGLQVVGIALDDPERARRFAEPMELSFPVLLGEADAVLTGRRYGNATGMLPFTVLVDREGIIRWASLGALERSELEAEIAKLQ